MLELDADIGIMVLKDVLGIVCLDLGGLDIMAWRTKTEGIGRMEGGVEEVVFEI